MRMTNATSLSKSNFIIVIILTVRICISLLLEWKSYQPYDIIDTDGTAITLCQISEDSVIGLVFLTFVREVLKEVNQYSSTSNIA